jgi:hypothetical protein
MGQVSSEEIIGSTLLSLSYMSVHCYLLHGGNSRSLLQVWILLILLLTGSGQKHDCTEQALRQQWCEVIIDTLQITVGGQDYWLTRGWDDITVTLESGQPATFLGSAIDIALPARNADGTQDLKFAISNIDGVVSTAIRNALDNLNNASLTFRRYVSSDLSAPAAPPYTLAIKNGSWTRRKYRSPQDI